MGSNMNQAALIESKGDGTHTIIIHLNLSPPNSVVEPQTSIKELNGNELRHEERLSNGHEKEDAGVTGEAFYAPVDDPPPSRFELKCHPNAESICIELDEFFATYWPWPDEHARQKFIASDVNRRACWALPLVRDDRVVNSVKVNTLLFLLDGKHLRYH